jgi:FAD/FMN-containing dehydrogenase
MCELFLTHMGGAVSRRPNDATAYAGRGAQFIMNVHARWEDVAQDAACVTWARSVFEATAPHAATGAYVNFMTQDEAGRVRAAYGDNYARLAAIKAKYDPTNLFRVNQNITPSAAALGPEMPAPRPAVRKPTPPPPA